MEFEEAWLLALALCVISQTTSTWPAASLFAPRVNAPLGRGFLRQCRGFQCLRARLFKPAQPIGKCNIALSCRFPSVRGLSVRNPRIRRGSAEERSRLVISPPHVRQTRTSRPNGLRQSTLQPDTVRLQ